MRRKMLASKILSVIIVVTACLSVNDRVLISLAAETAVETVSAIEGSNSEDSKNVNTALEDTLEASEDGNVAATDESANPDDNYGATALVEETVEAITGEAGESSEEGTNADDGQTNESPLNFYDINLTDEEDLNTKEVEREDNERLQVVGEGYSNEEEISEMMEIIQSDGVKAIGGNEDEMPYDAWPRYVEDVLEVEVIDADVDVASTGCTLLGVAGKFITEPDEAIARINEIRKEACEEGVLNPITGQPLTEADYVPIKWSWDLEYIARIRAVESAFTLAHTRLNGKSIWGLASPSGVRSYGEVLAWSQRRSMVYGIELWYGEKTDWVNQTPGTVTGHYTEMIDPSNLYVGIGTFCSVDTSYYNSTAGEFSNKSGLNESRMGLSGNYVQMVDVSNDYLSSDGEILGTLYGAKGSTRNLLLASTINYYIESQVLFLNDVDWSSSNEEVVTVAADGTATAVGSGTATIQASVANGTVTASAEFTVKSIEDCDITLGQTSYTYDGNAMEPSVTVFYKESELIEGTDYSISYEDNINAGTATVLINGSGEYTGNAKKTFVIQKAAQVLRAQDVNVAVDSTAKISVNGGHTALSFKSRVPSVATIDAYGTVTGVNAGETVVSVLAEENENYKAGQVQVHVTVHKVEQDFSNSAGSLGFDVGKNGVLTVTGAVGEVSASVGNSEIAEVSSVNAVEGEEGTYKIVITGAAVGSTKLTVIAAGDGKHEAAVVFCGCKVRPNAATNFKAAAATDGKGIKITWTKVSGATNYVIFRNGKELKPVGNVATWTDTGANTNGTKYTFKIYAKAVTGVSSQYRSVVYYKLNRPEKPTANNSAPKKITVKWAKNSKATGYQIQYGLKSNYSGAKTQNVSKNSIVSRTIGNLTKGKTYYVRVRALKKVSGKTYYSAWSTTRKVKISK